MGENGQTFFAILVDEGSELAAVARGLFAEYEIDHCCKSNPYSAYAAALKSPSSNTIIITGLDQLTADPEKFLHKLAEKDLLCCCLCTPRTAGLATVKKTARLHRAAIIESASALEDWLQGLLQTGAPKLAADFNKNDYSPTQAELNALLETANGKEE